MKTIDENAGMSARTLSDDEREKMEGELYHWQDWEKWAEAQRPQWQAQLNETRRIYRFITNCSPGRSHFMAADIAAECQAEEDKSQERLFLTAITVIGIALVVFAPLIGGVVLK